MLSRPSAFFFYLFHLPHLPCCLLPSLLWFSTHSSPPSVHVSHTFPCLIFTTPLPPVPLSAWITKSVLQHISCSISAARSAWILSFSFFFPSSRFFFFFLFSPLSGVCTFFPSLLTLSLFFFSPPLSPCSICFSCSFPLCALSALFSFWFHRTQLFSAVLTLLGFFPSHFLKILPSVFFLYAPLILRRVKSFL